MKYDKYEKRYSAWKGKGVYLALGCCILSLGLAGLGIFTSHKKSESLTTQPNIIITNAPDRQVNRPVTDIPDTRIETEIQTETTAANSAEFILPCGAEIIKDFSRGEPVESKTMGDYRVHSGIDFKAAKGDDVKAAADGKILSVSDNSLWGTVIEIDHGNGVIAEYCGLMKNPPVKKGDEVSAGKIIGRVGDIPCETADGVHLHFATKINKKSVDPLEILGRAE